MFLKIILFLSLSFNVALYFGWMNLGQFRDTVDKSIQTGQQIWEDEATQEFLANTRDRLQEAFGGDIDALRAELEGKSKEYIQDYLESTFTGESDAMIQTATDYIYMADQIEQENLKQLEGDIQLETDTDAQVDTQDDTDNDTQNTQQ